MLYYSFTFQEIPQPFGVIRAFSQQVNGLGGSWKMPTFFFFFYPEGCLRESFFIPGIRLF